MNFLEVLSQSLQQDQNAFKRVVDLDKNNEIEYKNFSEVTGCDQTSCPINMTDFVPDEVIAQLPCKHCFNKDAILQWLVEESHKCPVCRYELNYKEIRTEEEKQIDYNDISIDDIEQEIAELDLSDNEVFHNDISNNDISNNDIASLINSVTPQQIVDSFILNNVDGNNENTRTILNNFIHFLDNEIQRREMLELENDENELQRAIINSLME
jgi:hypothetical protein